ncbi:hypothetical protein BG910_01720 [Neisseria chenwenguii]|uniref:Uncharacterized protein n=1 Tax=Neisseria chenwenguii TaxID=1853278 RepID=A0A220RZH9_9NEIS|nr:hypothetical protein BG910_01720 [Neisseria chenwenguii]
MFVRDNLNWINRVLDDSSYGDEAVNRFLKQHATRHVAPLLALIRQADKTAQAAKNVPIQRFVFLMSSVNGPMITGDHLIGCGLWPSEFEGQFAPQILSDEAIKQRIDWAFAALFPDAAQAPESN